MKEEYPESVLKLAESLEGRLVTNRSQVTETDIVVAFSFHQTSNPEKPAVLAFSFSDPTKQNEFSSTVLRAYEDATLFAPWTLGEYLREPAMKYFTRFGNDGSSGPAQPGVSACDVAKKNG